MPRLNEHLSVLLDETLLSDDAAALPAAARFAPLPPVAKLGYYRYNELHSRTSIPYRQPRQDRLCGLPCGARPPRTAALCRLLAVTTVLLVLIHLVSCGLFFCVTLPFQRHNYVDLGELLAETSLLGGTSSTAGSGSSSAASNSSPKLIPRIIHQTFRSRQVPENAKSIMRSWQDHNGNNWQFRFYDDEACLDFVRREFPEYLEAYKALPKDVERSDFFRYMVVLRLGGVYADIDVECRQPLDKVIRPTDTMVVGWESEVPTDAQAYKRHFARKRQVLQWFFAAAPGHPVLRQICEHIAHNTLRVFSNNTNRDTLERTGPGIWTDIVLRHSMRHPMHKLDDPYKVRVLPRVAFGVHPAGIDGLTPDAREIVVLHHFMGSWKVRGGWYKKKPLLRQVQDILAPVLPWLRPSQGQQLEEPIRDTGVSHFPVSAAFEPPFVIMVDLIGHGDVQAGADVSALISNWGTWQPALAPTRKPSVVEALVGSLGGHKRRSLLVDVGAGHGFFSLAAAARGHRVHAFELSNSSRAALQASVKYNGFESLVTVHPLALGASNSSICLQPAGKQASVHQQRGYGDPALLAATNSSGCGEYGTRSTLAAALDNVTDVGAMRISTNGHEGWVVEGAVPYLTTHPPAVIYLEFAPSLMRKANYSDPARLLELLYSLGYQDIAHAGYVCDERWYNITSELRSQASFSSSAQEALQQPTWCKLRPEQFHLLVAQAHDEVPENVLLVYKHSGASQEEARSRPAGQQQQQQQQAGNGSSDGSGQPPPGLAAPVLQQQQQQQVAGEGGGGRGRDKVGGGDGGAPTAEAAAAGRSVSQLGSSTAQAASNFLHGASGPRAGHGSATADTISSSSSSSSSSRDLSPGSRAL